MILRDWPDSNEDSLMTRHLLYTLLPAVGLLVAAAPAAAQYPYPYPSNAYGAGGRAGPVLSPYLNLLNGRGTPAVNYYNFVQPNLQLQQQQLYGGGGFTPLDPYGQGTDLTADPTKALPRATGLPTTFMNYGGYYNSMGTMGAMGNRGGQQAAGGRAPAPNTSVPRR
jgi:hypothetical protein